MAERLLLSHYPNCIVCGKSSAEVDLVREHLLDRKFGELYPDIFGPVVYGRKNWAYSCWEDQKVLTNQKERAFKRSGVVGVLNYVANKIPDNLQGEMLIVARQQFAEVFAQIAINIEGLGKETYGLSVHTIKRMEERSKFYQGLFEKLAA